jgi:DNA-binding ferritin-like protein
MDASYLQSLHTLTADYQVLYQKLRAYRWMVTGPLFFGLHEQFEQLYTETAEKLDGWLGEVADGAEAAGDTTTFNLADGFRDGQKKTAWILRAFLGGPAPVGV